VATEFNYVARLDTSQIMSGLSEIRSQVGMALGGGGFGGGGLAQTNFGGGVSTGMNQMMGAMGGMGGGRGGTYTDPAIAYSPHYGMQGAQTTLAQEGLVAGPDGMAMAGRMAPPGVSAGEFAMAVTGNNIERSIQARQAASMAAQSSIASIGGGLIADRAGSWVGTAAGGWAGSAAATSMFGAEAAGAGAAIGGLAGGVGLGLVAMNYVSDKIQAHFADIGQGVGTAKEMGDIVGSGRNLTRTQQAELGLAARDASMSIKMDPNQFGDIMALARENGMLPSSTDPGKAKQQYMDYAAAIREGAEMVHGSLSQATQVIKNATQKGLTLEEGFMRATGVGGDGGLGSMMYGMGASTARGMGFTGAQGGQLFSGALGQASASGISGEEMTILGGRTGVAALIGGTQLAAASSPMGMMQLMAARGGQPLGGMMDLPGQALDAMSQGGDMISNMGKFQVHSDEYRRSIGSSGIRAMAMNQIEGMSDIISDLMPGMSGNEAKRMAAMNMYGMTGTQAEAYIGGLEHRPGGGGSSAETKRRQIAALADGSQDTRLGATMSAIPGDDRPGFGLGGAVSGAISGAVLGGGIPGAIVGAGVGLVVENARAAAGVIGDVFNGIGNIFESTEEGIRRRTMEGAAAYDKTEAGIKAKMGYIDFDPDTAARTAGADLSGMTLGWTSGSKRATAMTETALRLSGMTPVAAGVGTIQAGGLSWDAKQYQAAAMNYGGLPLTKKELSYADHIAYQVGMDPDASGRIKLEASADISKTGDHLSTQDRLIMAMGQNIETIAKDPGAEAARDAAIVFNANARSLFSAIKDPKERARAMKGLENGAIGENDLQGATLRALGVPMDKLKGQALQITAALGAAGADTLEAYDKVYSHVIARAFGDGRPLDASTVTAKGMRGEDHWSGKGGVEDMIRRGNFKGANTEAQLAYESYLIHHRGEDVAKLNMKDFDVTKRFHTQDGVAKHDRQAQEIRTGTMDLGWFSVPLPKLSEADKAKQMAKIDKDFSTEGQSIADGVLGQIKTTDQLKAKRHGPASASHAIGFGEQEQAMTAINKSLQRTASMIQAMDKRISSLPGVSGGGGTSGGGMPPPPGGTSSPAAPPAQHVEANFGK